MVNFRRNRWSISAKSPLDSYSEISLFLDNDKAGTQCKYMITKHFSHAKDFSHLYSDHKDLNQYLTAKRQQHAHETINKQITTAAKNEQTEKQNDCKEETNRIKKGVRRRM